MATARRIIDTRSLSRIPRVLERYRQTVNREAYKGLKDVAKSAVDVMQMAVRSAPPTRYPSTSAPVKGSRSKLPAMPLVNNGAVASGRYLKSWKAKRMTMAGVMGVLIYNSQPYAPNVEYGRFAGRRMPPVSAIRQWLQKKFSLPYRQAKRLAYPVAASIKKHGIPGRKILTAERTADALFFYLEEAVEKAIQRAVRVVFP